MTITPTSHDDIADLKFDNVAIDAKAPVYSDDNVTFTGSYSTAENTDSLLFNKHNNNKAFEAAFRVKDIKGNGFAFRDWAAVDSESALQNNTLVLKAGKKEQVHNITISDEINGGTVSADETIAAAGDTVTLTVTPDTGRNVKSIFVNNGAVDVTDNGNGTYSFEMPDGDVTVGAEFEKQKFTVTWKNGDAVLETDENVEYGTTPEYNGETPTKDADVQYTYTFSDWSPAVDAVTGNVTYTAQFSKTVNKYTVTWKNGDTILETDEDVEYGAIPEYNGETPTKAMDDKYTYKFSDWSPAISSVEGDIVYTALFIVAVRPKCGDRAYWSFDESTGKLTISGTGNMYDYSYENLPWDNYLGKITSVEIENGITSIGICAFYNCARLESVTIPDSVESIGDYALYYCPKLKPITIPEKVTSIGTDAFCGCRNITDVYCYADPDKLTWNEVDCDDFIRSPKHTTVCHVPVKYYWQYVKKFGTGSETPVNVTFDTDAPHGQCGESAYWLFDSDTGKLTISGTGAMYDYDYNTQPWNGYRNNITSVEIENGITSIGEYAFYNCTSLESVTIPDSVTSIGADAFYECTNITDVYCYADPANLTWNEVGCNDFIWTTKHTTVCHVPAKYYLQYVKKFGKSVNVTFDTDAPHGQCGESAYWLFDSGKLTIIGTGDMYNYYDTQPWYNYKDNITSVEIENGITSIGYSAFESCANLTSITIPDSVTSIGNYTFYGCTSLESITIPEKVTSIGRQSFQNCTSLKSITIPDSVESIGEQTFQNCTSLESITIPEKVTSIGADAFSSCTSLTSVKMSKNVTSIGDQAFFDCTSLASITIPNSVTSIGRDAFLNCTNIKDIYCDADPDTLTWDEDGCNDFMGAQESRETVCHVPAEYLETYEAKFGAGSDYPVNVRFVGDVDMGLGEHLYGHSITLDGSIGVNFYVELTDELLASENAEMVFTAPNGSKTDTQTLLVKDVIADDSNKVVIGSKTYYKFKCSISAKDMASTMTAQLIDGESKGTEYTYSVKDYADYLLAHTEVKQYEKAAPLVKAMLNYGAASQTYFGIEGTAANASLTDEEKALGEASDLDTFELDNNVALPEGVTFEGATLSLKSETTLSLYFKGLAEGTKFTCDGKTVETAKNGEYVVARIRGIKASELENSFTVKFGESSETYNVTYNVMTYCYNVLNDSTVDDNLQNVCKALYKYTQAAKTYSE